MPKRPHITLDRMRELTGQVAKDIVQRQFDRIYRGGGQWFVDIANVMAARMTVETGWGREHTHPAAREALARELEGEFPTTQDWLEWAYAEGVLTKGNA